MIKKVNHIAVAVPDLALARKTYEQIGCVVSDPKELREHGVCVSFVEFENVTLELMEPLGEDSPIDRFMAKNPKGGMHHICFEVPDLTSATTILEKGGIRRLGPVEPKIGAHGNPVFFANPSDMFGVLLEFEEAS